MKTLRITLLLLLAELGSCINTTDRVPDVTGATFAEVYTDLFLQSEKMEAGNERLFADRRDSILHSHRLDSASFASALQYYSSDVRRWKSISEMVIQRLEQLQSVENGVEQPAGRRRVPRR